MSDRSDLSSRTPWSVIHREAHDDPTSKGSDDDEHENDEDYDDEPPKRREPPERGPLGTRSRQRIAYVVPIESGAPLSLGPLVGPRCALSAFIGAPNVLSRWKTSLAIVEGTIWRISPSYRENDTLEVAESVGDVYVSDGNVVSVHGYEDIVEAWLRGLVRVAEDPAQADATILETTPATFHTALLTWKGWTVTIASVALRELERATLPRPPAAPEDPAALFARAREGDRDASLLLEDEAWRLRNLTLYRFARATSEGKTAIARLYASRVRLP